MYCSTPQSRKDVKNHSLSFLTGPPSATLMSHTLLSASRRPQALARSRRPMLSDCIESLPAGEEAGALERLPPSLGIMFARTPPAEVSALMALVW